jgi:flagellar biosynthesis component FlhA
VQVSTGVDWKVVRSFHPYVCLIFISILKLLLFYHIQECSLLNVKTVEETERETEEETEEETEAETEEETEEEEVSNSAEVNALSGEIGHKYLPKHPRRLTL